MSRSVLHEGLVRFGTSLSLLVVTDPVIEKGALSWSAVFILISV